MSGFSDSWLGLREPADARARNRDLANALAAWYLTRKRLSVIDLGCGTGSDLRAMAQLLPKSQSWLLVDHDAQLLAAASGRLRAWSNTSELLSDGSLQLTKGAVTLSVKFQQMDFAAGFKPITDFKPDLVTASAFFDLMSPALIRELASTVAGINAAFCTVLTYNGIQKWTPRRPADNQIISAFHRHQLRDKGLGPAAGPTAPTEIADQFRLNSYTVEEGDSPWRLDRRDDRLIAELKRGHISAVSEVGGVDDAILRQWNIMAHTAVEIGHTDTLAFPSGRADAGQDDRQDDWTSGD